MAAGAIARKIVPGMLVRGALVQIGPHEIDRRNLDWEGGRETIRSSARRQGGEGLGRIPRPGAEEGLIGRRRDRDRGRRRAAGLGAPVYGKLDQDIAAG